MFRLRGITPCNGFRPFFKAHPVFPSAPHFVSTPTSGQFAKGGAWEHAWSFQSHCLPDPSRLHAYLGESTEVAFEAFFGDAFFGARIEGSASVIRSFADQCMQAMRAANHGECFLAAFSQHLQLGPLGDVLAFAEVGAVNAWRSVGALRIQAPRGALFDFESVWDALERSPVGRDALHRKAIEFAFNHPLSHWFGISISAPDAPCKVSPSLLRDALLLFPSDEFHKTPQTPR